MSFWGGNSQAEQLERMLNQLLRGSILQAQSPCEIIRTFQHSDKATHSIHVQLVQHLLLRLPAASQLVLECRLAMARDVQCAY